MTNCFGIKVVRAVPRRRRWRALSGLPTTDGTTVGPVWRQPRNSPRARYQQPESPPININYCQHPLMQRQRRFRQIMLIIGGKLPQMPESPPTHRG